jgi:hypothetical protein
MCHLAGGQLQVDGGDYQGLSMPRMQISHSSIANWMVWAPGRRASSALPRLRPPLHGRRRRSHGRKAQGDAQGWVSAERFETPLVGGAARLWRRGGNPPAPTFPQRGKRERGDSNSLLPQAIFCPAHLCRQLLASTQMPEFPLLLHPALLSFPRADARGPLKQRRDLRSGLGRADFCERLGAS